MTRCAHKALPWLIPCDISDFINLYPSIRHDKAFVVIIALLKEPSATASFVKKALALAPEYGVDALAAVLLEMLDEIRPPTEVHRKELEALNQQGVGRFLGVASTCRVWELIECVPEEGGKDDDDDKPAGKKKTPKGQCKQKPKKLPAEEPKRQKQAQKQQGKREALPLPRRRATRRKTQQRDAEEGEEQASPVPRRRAEEEEHWHLGLNRRVYRPTGAHERLGDLLQAAREFRQPPEIVNTTTVKEMVAWAEEFDEFLGQKSMVWAGQVGYVHDSLRRKLVLGQLSSSCCADVQWSEVPIDILKRMSPDQGGYLSRVPVKWTAADVSRYIAERDDWGVFVSMFSCLWGAVTQATAYKGHRDALIKLVASDQFRDAAKDHIQKYHVAARVLMLVKQFGPVDTWPKIDEA